MSETSEHDNFNDNIVTEFRANDGKVGGYFDGQQMLLLHHKGAKTGTERVNPLVYQPLDGDRIAIFASKGGAPDNPQWYHNLLATPDTTIEIGSAHRHVHAHEAGPAERGPIWDKQKSDLPHFATYETTAAPREIPVIILDPIG